MFKPFFFIYLFFLFFFLGTSSNSQIQNTILVKIDKKIITTFDIKNTILASLLISKTEINQENINLLKKKALERLINLRLKEIELEKFDSIKVSQQSLNSRINQLSQNNIQELKNNFKNYELDYELWSKEIEIDLRWKRYIFAKYSNRIEIDKNMVEKEIHKISKTKLKINEVNLSEIVVLQDDKLPNEKIISNILEEIKKNGFENSALKLSVSESSSEKGNLGWFNLEILSNNIKNAVKNLKPGEISEPIYQSNSILFLKLNSIRTLQNDKLDLENLKLKLIQQKQNELFNLYSKSHLSKLKNKHFIQY